ncbi:MAG: gamma-glutamyltransferase [Ectothiorhodospiraceae bacterium]|nr:gamma-glutamyltransferase [Chromatiales bacterium]MCP5153732.1 gamma-glutamyltransferase [Ectothiorhodospiraceae bacterium]
MPSQRGIVAAGHPLTAEAAEHVLREGGNAFDAVIAAMAAACVVEPVLASLGGGGFLLAHPVATPPRVYDFFVQTPRRRAAVDELDFYEITADFGPVTQAFHIGRGTVAVPGVVRGAFEIHRDLATMSMRDLLAPAVENAKRGVAVSDFQAYLFRVVEATFAATPASRAIFGHGADASPADRDRPSGRLLGAGERLVQPELADTLETLAFEGPDLFYRGEIAAAMARDLASGGQVAMEDLRAYTVERRAPLLRDHGGARLLTNPPPSSGGLLVAFGLALLEGSDLADHAPGSLAAVSLIAEVLAATVEARIEAQARDPSHRLHRETVLDAALVARYRETVLDRARASRGTTQVSVIDAAGNLASLTLSNGEGSGYVVPGTGVVMNNMLGEDDLNPGGFQRWSTDTRLVSMMAPSAVLWPDGRRIATGSGGSNRIRSAVLQVVANVLHHRLGCEAAVHAPRLHVEGEHLSIEGGHDVEQLAPLLERWPSHHVWPDRNLFFGGAHTVEGGPRGLDGAGDARRGGVCRMA